MRTWLHNRWSDVSTGLRTPPRDLVSWLLIVPYAAIALPLGLGSGLLDASTPPLWEIFVVPLILVVYPSLIEEAIFRGVLLPRSLRTATFARQAAFVALSTAVFVVYHPLNRWLVSLSDTSDFTDPVFLVIAALLGLTCAVQYLRSGSLWIPIATHWITGVAWNLFLGRNLEI